MISFPPACFLPLARSFRDVFLPDQVVLANRLAFFIERLKCANEKRSQPLMTGGRRRSEKRTRREIIPVDRAYNAKEPGGDGVRLSLMITRWAKESEKCRVLT